MTPVEHLPEFELYTTAQDFSHEAVRQRKLEIIEEICQRYDVDGFELDYIRHPVLFSRRMRGESCTADESRHHHINDGKDSQPDGRSSDEAG